MRFGCFAPPITRPDQNPTWALERQLELVEWCDRLGFDEYLFGEHHNGGWELICCPEIMIAAAAQRTRNIMLGTGVTSLPYHHPFIVAERMVMLDHLTRGRVILGTGPGSLPSDAYYLGLDYSQSRRRAAESLEVIVRLLETDEPITMETDWFSLRDAQLHLRPYTQPRFEIIAASTLSPAGPRMAGKFGVSLLTLGATSSSGFEALARIWETLEEEARLAGRPASREAWRIVGFFHLADTDAQAREDVRYGLLKLLEYLGTTSGNILEMLSDVSDLDTTIDELNESGLMVIGTADRMVEHLEAFQKQTGGFGGFLGFGTDMADREATLRSHELLMRDVAPRFQHSVSRQLVNFDRLKAGGESKGSWGEMVAKAQEQARKAYEETRAGRV
jgi:limonene 1,2-monooxygenase